MILELVLKWAIPTVLGGAVGLITYMLKSNQAMREGMILLLRSQLVSKCEKAIKEGFISDDMRSCISDLFSQYDKLKANHGVKYLVEKALMLPPKKREV